MKFKDLKPGDTIVNINCEYYVVGFGPSKVKLVTYSMGCLATFYEEEIQNFKFKAKKSRDFWLWRYKCGKGDWNLCPTYLDEDMRTTSGRKINWMENLVKRKFAKLGKVD